MVSHAKTYKASKKSIGRRTIHLLCSNSVLKTLYRLLPDVALICAVHFLYKKKKTSSFCDSALSSQFNLLKLWPHHTPENLAGKDYLFMTLWIH